MEYQTDIEARPLHEWGEDYGPVLWMFFPIAEAPWVGTPLDDDWRSGYFTHWTPLPIPARPDEERDVCSCEYCREEA